MILRLDAKLAKKLGVKLAGSPPLDAKPYHDWTGRLFRANRLQFVLLTNTASLYTVIFPSRGITTPSGYAQQVARELEALRERSDSAAVREGLAPPAGGEVSFGKSLNRSVTGSINDQVFHAKLCLEERSMSLLETAAYLNRMPMLSLEAIFPHKAFAALAVRPASTVNPQEPEMSQAIYQLKITLKGTKPPIWRRVEVPGQVTLDALHGIIQGAMGWLNCHLYDFDIGGQSYTDAKTAAEYGDGVVTGVRLDSLLRQEGARLNYTYDFGDSWEHLIVLEKILAPEAGVTYPRCTAGRRACPPEDVGGIWGYDEFLEAIGNPKHPDHEDMLDWVGDDFDPDAFDLEAANRVI